MATDYGGPERRVEPRDEAFERAVRQASKLASQEVAKVHRRRLVVQSFLASLTVALFVAVVIGMVFRAEAIDQATREGQYNCQLVQDLSATLGDFIATDARIRSRQGSGNVQQRIIADLARVVPLGDLTAAAAASAVANAETVRYWTHVDLPRLRALAETNCSSGLP